ncbi:hypothetical protein AGLY_005712 [Aphis glycines]|uniref:Uncharacterized protein n=1 Tax=Aphis glycines TaxID=307491 RepID=A0A6G0TVW7_APHGL|nr:hypothetical protein AGLY_005712 [Aphis glycines]
MKLKYQRAKLFFSFITLSIDSINVNLSNSDSHVTIFITINQIKIKGLLLSCEVLLQISVTSFNLLHAYDIELDLSGDKSNISPLDASVLTITLLFSDSFCLQPLIAVVSLINRHEQVNSIAKKNGYGSITFRPKCKKIVFDINTIALSLAIPVRLSYDYMSSNNILPGRPGVAKQFITNNFKVDHARIYLKRMKFMTKKSLTTLEVGNPPVAKCIRYDMGYFSYVLQKLLTRTAFLPRLKLNLIQYRLLVTDILIDSMISTIILGSSSAALLIPLDTGTSSILIAGASSEDKDKVSFEQPKK